MSTVYLIAQPTIAKNGHQPDLTPLAEYGEVRLVTEPGENRILQRARERLKLFDPEKDYLTWAGGDTLAAVLAGVVLTEMGFDFFTWLKFRRPRNSGVAGKERVETKDNRGHYEPVLVVL